MPHNLSRAGLYVLFLAGPLLGFATKGFAPMLAVAGALATAALILQPEKLKAFNWKVFLPLTPFLAFALLSVFWSGASNPLGSFGVLFSVLIFTCSLWIAFSQLSEAEQTSYRNYLSASLLFGIIASIAVGSYSQFFPELKGILSDLSNQTTLANIELVRQGNRSLSLMPILLFLIAGFYWNKSRFFFVLLFFFAAYIAANSESQTSLLGLIIGGALLVFSISLKKHGRKLFFFAFAFCLLISPLLFIKSFENKWVETYAPKIVLKKATGTLRQWIYFTYGREALHRPLFGHGFEASHYFTPEDPHYYLKLGKQRKMGKYTRDKEKGLIFPHPHNFPVQFIFEFGYIGALLLLFGLWQVIRRDFIKRSNPSQDAAIAAAIGMMLFAYSMWQSWLIASLGFSFLYAMILYAAPKQPPASPE